MRLFGVVARVNVSFRLCCRSVCRDHGERSHEVRALQCQDTNRTDYFPAFFGSPVACEPMNVKDELLRKGKHTYRFVTFAWSRSGWVVGDLNAQFVAQEEMVRLEKVRRFVKSRRTRGVTCRRTSGCRFEKWRDPRGHMNKLSPSPLSRKLTISTALTTWCCKLGGNGEVCKISSASLDLITSEV